MPNLRKILQIRQFHKRLLAVSDWLLAPDKSFCGGIGGGGTAIGCFSDTKVQNIANNTNAKADFNGGCEGAKCRIFALKDSFVVKFFNFFTFTRAFYVGSMGGFARNVVTVVSVGADTWQKWRQRQQFRQWQRCFSCQFGGLLGCERGEVGEGCAAAKIAAKQLSAFSRQSSAKNKDE